MRRRAGRGADADGAARRVLLDWGARDPEARRAAAARRDDPQRLQGVHGGRPGGGRHRVVRQERVPARAARDGGGARGAAGALAVQPAARGARRGVARPADGARPRRRRRRRAGRLAAAVGWADAAAAQDRPAVRGGRRAVPRDRRDGVRRVDRLGDARQAVGGRRRRQEPLSPAARRLGVRRPCQRRVGHRAGRRDRLPDRAGAEGHRRGADRAAAVHAVLRVAQARRGVRAARAALADGDAPRADAPPPAAAGDRRAGRRGER